MYEKELEAMKRAALHAEKAIMEIYGKPFDVEIKSDSSPVTAADKLADKMIREELHAAFPDYGLLTEESKDDLSRRSKDYIFIVDPVDGTKEFVKRNGEFCTNIALAYKGQAVAGIINVPVKGIMYFATLGGGAFKQERGKEPVKIHVDDKTSDLTVFESKSFFNAQENAYIEKHLDKIKHRLEVGAALKFCYIAEGKGEIFYRCSQNTKEWDIASGDIILTEAGGIMEKFDGTKYSYNREDVYNRDGYILANRRENILL